MTVEEAKTRFRYVESRGGYWIVGNMRVIDEEPAILESLKPVFLEDEVPILTAMTPAQRDTFWTGRVKALESERELRALDPGRNCYGPSNAAMKQAAAAAKEAAKEDEAWA